MSATVVERPRRYMTKAQIMANRRRANARQRALTQLRQLHAAEYERLYREALQEAPR